MIEVIPEVITHVGPWSLMVFALITGSLSAIGSVFGNKKINDLSRQKYELMADKKIDIKFEKISKNINNNFDILKSNQANMSEKIDINTEITKEYSGTLELIDEFAEIKKEALGWSKKEGSLSDLVIIKANSMISLFSNMLSENLEDLSVSNIKSEMQVQIIKVRKTWEDVLPKEQADFPQYFYNVSHNVHIDGFFTEINWLLNPQRKINNIDVKKEMKITCIRFFRHSLENLLSAWDSYNK